MKTICRILGINRSSYYAWLKRPETKRNKANLQLLEKLKSLHQESRGTYGAPRLTAQLKSLGYSCGRHRVAQLMRKQGIFGCARRKFRAIGTTQSNHNWPISPRVFEMENKETFPTAPHQVWAGDITYIATREGWLYLAVVMDIFSRKVVGYSMANHMRPELAWEAMKIGACQQKGALTPRSPTLISHSDRGGQYAANSYREKLELLGVTQSMSRKGNCYDNALVESFFHTLKVELVYRDNFRTRIEAQNAIQEYIDGWYNRKRLHSALGYLSPCDYENKALVA
jgi:putative transposase